MKKSCKLLKTTYLDAVYIHDVEFIADDLGAISDRSGNPEAILDDQYLLERAGLSDLENCKSQGIGDDLVLEAVSALFELKKQGIVHRVGISGKPTSFITSSNVKYTKSLADLFNVY